MDLRSFSIVELQKENELNKILRNQRKTGASISLLYVSLWDEPSQKLLGVLKNKYKASVEGLPVDPLYVINSFTMPHSFVIFKTTVLPHLVLLRKNSVTSLDYLSHIYHRLGV